MYCKGRYRRETKTLDGITLNSKPWFKPPLKGVFLTSVVVVTASQVCFIPT